MLVDCRPAREALGLPERTVLHSGPPLPWERACPPVQAAVLCAIRYEGWAADDAAAQRLVVSGAITHRAVPRIGRGRAHDGHRHAVHARLRGGEPGSRQPRVRRPSTRAWARCCASAPTTTAVIERLRWLDREAGPLLGAALRGGGGIDLRAVMAQALRMGDEMHQRNVAASLPPRPAIAHAASGAHDAERRRRRANGGVRRRQRPVLPEPRHGRGQGRGRSVSRRGGLDHGGDDGAQRHGVRHPRGRPRRPLVHRAGERPPRPLLPRLRRRTTRTRTSATAPSWRRLGSVASLWRRRPPWSDSWARAVFADAIRITEEMAEICLGEHPHVRVPTLDERGTPVGIDVRQRG